VGCTDSKAWSSLIYVCEERDGRSGGNLQAIGVRAVVCKVVKFASRRRPQQRRPGKSIDAAVNFNFKNVKTILCLERFHTQKRSPCHHNVSSRRIIWVSRRKVRALETEAAVDYIQTVKRVGDEYGQLCLRSVFEATALVVANVDEGCHATRIPDSKRIFWMPRH
jgi:hypothetical protein